MVSEPGEGSEQVGMVALQPVVPGGLLGPPEKRSSPLCQIEKGASVCCAGRVVLTEQGQPISAELAHGLQETETGLAVRFGDWLHEVLINERRQQVERVCVARDT